VRLRNDLGRSSRWCQRLDACARDFFSGANSEDHSQIVRFVSSFISGTLTGISRAGGSMGVVLPSYVGVRQQKCGFAPT
jgi:hypothetical protein